MPKTSKTGMPPNAFSINYCNQKRIYIMDKKLEKYLDEAFKPYGDFPAKSDVKAELLGNLEEKYDDLKAGGKSDDEAYQATIDSVGDIAEIMEHVPHDPAPEPAPEGRNLS